MSDLTAVEPKATALTEAELQEMLRRMYRVRRFDEAGLKLVAAGELPGAMHTSIGQEAEVVGACMALTDRDYMTGNHPSHGTRLRRGRRCEV
jgi:TPP-dependent pyruvate/acetoin dehydrogenase alpha subunit